MYNLFLPKEMLEILFVFKQVVKYHHLNLNLIFRLTGFLIFFTGEFKSLAFLPN